MFEYIFQDIGFILKINPGEIYPHKIHPLKFYPNFIKSNNPENSDENIDKNKDNEKHVQAE